MKVRFWGVRGSTPTPSRQNLRYGGNTPCVELRTQSGELFVFDGGTGLRTLGKSLMEEFGHSSIQASIFLSHYHWDHIHGIPFFEPLYNPENSFFFHSYPSQDQSVQRALEEQMSDPYFPVNMGTMAARRRFHNLSDDKISFNDAVIWSKRLNHPQGCLGFRFESRGRSVVYATDNEPGVPEYDRNVRDLAEGAEVFICDAQYTPLEYVNFKKGWGHGSWREAVNIAKDAGVKHLILFHHDPDHNDDFIDSILHEASRYFPSVAAAAEGMELVFQSDGVEMSRFLVERRGDTRHPMHLPLLVHGRTREGVKFTEQTVLENVSLKGGYFFLQNDPNPDDEIELHVSLSTQLPAALPGMMPLKSRLIRVDDEQEKNRRGVAVSFQ